MTGVLRRETVFVFLPGPLWAVPGTAFFGGTFFGGSQYYAGTAFLWRFPVPHFLAVLSSAVRNMTVPPSVVHNMAVLGETYQIQTYHPVAGNVGAVSEPDGINGILFGP